MAVTQPYVGSFTASTTELSLVSGTSTLQNITTAGCYQAFLDLTNMANGDVYEFRIYEKVQSGSTKHIIQCYTFTDAQGADNAIWVSPALMLLNGWDFTLKRTAGADRTIEYSIRTP